MKPPPPANDYVGSQVCAECHREIADRYATHPMGRSSGPLATVAPIEDYSESAAFRTADGKRYFVERTDTAFVHREQLIGDDSAPLYDQGVPMELSIGSGRRGRSYAYLRGDRFLMSPIGWYTAKECWDLSPGYLPGRHQRFERPITERCLGCHVGRMNLGPALDTWELEQPIVEHVIGCERCHGPGATHVEHHQNPQSFTGVDRIVNPVALDAHRRDAVCHQCHFKASNTVPRYGRRASDFRPGDRISDVWVVLAEKISERQAVTQSEQMLASACYKGSGGRLGCVSCHDPHELPAGDPAAAFDSKCAACHSDSHSPCVAPPAGRTGHTCISCHMPRFEAENIPHTALTDHRVLRDPRNQSAAQASDSTEPAWDEGEPTVPDWEVRRAKALSLRMNPRLAMNPRALEQAAADLLALRFELPDDPELWETLAWIRSRQGHWTDVESNVHRVLELAPSRMDARELLVSALSERGAWSEVRLECEKLIQQDPGRARYHRLLAEAAWHQGELESGLASAERSLELDPTQWELRRRLATAYEQMGDSERSQYHRKIVDGLLQSEP